MIHYLEYSGPVELKRKQLISVEFIWNFWKKFAKHYLKIFGNTFGKFKIWQNSELFLWIIIIIIMLMMMMMIESKKTFK